MIHGGPSLDELWHMAAQHHAALKGFVLRKAAEWMDPAIRRTANHGLAVLTSMIRRLLHLLALEVLLPPLRPRSELALIAALSEPRSPRHRFRLIESPRERCRREPNPYPTPDTPDLSQALFLERLAVLVDAYRARHRIARRLARRVQAGLAKLRATPLPKTLYARVMPGLVEVLDFLDDCIAVKARAPPCSTSADTCEGRYPAQ